MIEHLRDRLSVDRKGKRWHRPLCSKHHKSRLCVIHRQCPRVKPGSEFVHSMLELPLESRNRGVGRTYWCIIGKDINVSSRCLNNVIHEEREKQRAKNRALRSPAWRLSSGDKERPTTVRCWRPKRKLLNHSKALPWSPTACNLGRSPGSHTRSKAFLISKNTTPTCCDESLTVDHSWKSRMSCMWVLSFLRKPDCLLVRRGDKRALRRRKTIFSITLLTMLRSASWR